MSAQILLGTVLLERHRWGSREPSLRPSQWWPRIRAAGFAGLEIWEPHLASHPDEVEALATLSLPRVILNSYVTLDASGAQARDALTRAAWRLRAEGIKYNVGRYPSALADERAVLVSWASQLPPGCRLFCECHAGTALEDPAMAAGFLAGLEVQRHGVIVHPWCIPPSELATWVELLGDRLQHLHLQMNNHQTGGARFLAVADAQERVVATQRVLESAPQIRSATLEFCHGVAEPEETPDALLAQAERDLAALLRFSHVPSH